MPFCFENDCGMFEGKCLKVNDWILKELKASSFFVEGNFGGSDEGL